MPHVAHMMAAGVALVVYLGMALFTLMAVSRGLGGDSRGDSRPEGQGTVGQVEGWAELNCALLVEIH